MERNVASDVHGWIATENATKKIKRHKRTNKKNASLWKRRPKIQKNLRFLIYRLQDPTLMVKKYMNLNQFLNHKADEECVDNILPEDLPESSEEEESSSSLSSE